MPNNVILGHLIQLFPGAVAVCLVSPLLLLTQTMALAVESVLVRRFSNCPALTRSLRSIQSF